MIGVGMAVFEDGGEGETEFNWAHCKLGSVSWKSRIKIDVSASDVDAQVWGCNMEHHVMSWAI